MSYLVVHNSSMRLENATKGSPGAQGPAGVDVSTEVDIWVPEPEDLDAGVAFSTVEFGRYGGLVYVGGAIFGDPAIEPAITFPVGCPVKPAVGSVTFIKQRAYAADGAAPGFYDSLVLISESGLSVNGTAAGFGGVPGDATVASVIFSLVYPLDKIGEISG